MDVGTRHVGDPPRAPGEEQGMHILCFWSALNLCGGFLLPSTLAARFDVGGRAPASGLPPLPLPLQSSTGLCTSSFCFSGPRQEYWNGLAFPTPRDLPNPGIKPAIPVSPALAGGFFTNVPPMAYDLLYKEQES